MLVAVGNGPSYGGGMWVCPDARFDDGMFRHPLIVHQISTIEFPSEVFPKVFKWQARWAPRWEILRGKEVRLGPPALSAMPTANASRRLPMSLPERARRAERPRLRPLT